MSDRTLHSLTDLQLDVLNVVWDRGEATVSDVHAGLAPQRELARKTVGTIVRRLESYGFLSHRAEGREYLYRADVTPGEVRRATVSNIVRRLFGGDVPSLLSHALEAGEIERGDVERIEEMLREHRVAGDET